MSDTRDFKTRIQDRYPEGLTGLFAIGGTRTSYILEHNRQQKDPGHITDFEHYADTSFQKYMNIIRMFLELGGQHLVISVLSFRSFFERGPEYGQLASPALERLIGEDATRFYHEHHIAPYFVGIDTLLTYPEDSVVWRVANTLNQFQNDFVRKPDQHKLIWEIASIPLFSLWNVFYQLDSDERDNLQSLIDKTEGLEAIQTLLYNFLVERVIGVGIPTPQFYLGTNKSGDIKIRSPLFMSLTAGEYLRSYYLPYPSLFMEKNVLQTIMGDLAFNDRLHSVDTDYSGKLNPNIVEHEYERVVALASNPESVVGFTRKIDQYNS